MSLKLTTDIFIKRAFIIHGNFYDYSQVIYNNCKDKVIIICPIHGIFRQDPLVHLRGSGCPLCGRIKNGNNRKSNLKKFIKKANLIHNNFYNYSKAFYIKSKSKILIICPIHGEFFQSPSSHLSGQGCPNCWEIRKAENLKDTKEDFIRKADIIHKKFYDYSEVVYKNSKVKICIICPKHGRFFQIPNSHLNGKGCTICAGTQKSSTEGFIIKSKLVHNDKYIYSKVKYINIYTPVIIICFDCGNEFLQRPYCHLAGQGCPVCSAKNRSKNKTLSIDKFIKKAEKIHGNSYDYSKAVYINSRTKICIICRKCNNMWWQTPNDHLRNHGCPICIKSNGERLIRNLLLSNNIKFVQEKNYNDLLSAKGRRLRFDFYLPDKNTLIEFDGQQHYEKNCYFNKTKGLNFHILVENDSRKNFYCEKNNIPLIRIRYDENIINILKKYGLLNSK